MNQRLIEATRALGDTVVMNPVMSTLFNRGLLLPTRWADATWVKTHLKASLIIRGKCSHRRVERPCIKPLRQDGAIVPMSLDTNPFLTISALAERECALMAHDRGWTSRDDLPSQPFPEAAPPSPLGMQSTERMSGCISTRVRNDFAAGAAQGQRDHSPVEFVVALATDNLVTFWNITITRHALSAPSPSRRFVHPPYRDQRHVQSVHRRSG